MATVCGAFLHDQILECFARDSWQNGIREVQGETLR